MKHILRILPILVIALIAVGDLHGKQKQRSSGRDAAYSASCLTSAERTALIRNLASGTVSSERAVTVLSRKSKLSSKCRSEVITALMRAMNKPNLNFDRNVQDYYLWRYGAPLLGDLQASEAIDLLIKHLNLSRATYSSSMSHQPALLGVIQMGEIAVPKLGAVLQSDPDLEKRYSAIYCLATIGGESAMAQLRTSVAMQSDSCARRLIDASLDSFDEKGHIKDRMEWFGRFTCPPK